MGWFNESGYTAYQSKETGGMDGDLFSRKVGGKYTVDARMQKSDGQVGKWTRSVTDNTSYPLDGHVNHKKGNDVRVHFSNNWNTTVSVQVKGLWRSN